MKKVIYILIFACTLAVNAQEFKLSPFTQYLTENPYAISPTFAGMNADYDRIRLNAVSQWVGLKNSPNTQNLSYDLRFAEKSGAGILIYNDKNGATSQIGAQLSYAHHLILNDANEQYLSLGISYKFNQFKIETADFDDGTGGGNGGDPGVGAARSTTNHNFEFGALYRYEDFFFSINATNILNKKVDNFDVNEPNKLRNYYVYTGYTFVSNSEEFEYEPSIYYNLYESDSRSETHVNFKARKITDTGYMWAGLSGRLFVDQSFKTSSIAPMLGLKKDQFYVAYAFQWNVNEAKELNNAGTHLITLGFDLENNRNNASWSR